MSNGGWGRPVSAFALRAGIVVGSDAGEWLALDGDAAGNGPAAPRSLPPTARFAAAAVAGDTLTVACWSKELRQLPRLEDRSWRELPLGSPVLAMAATSRGLVLADAERGLSLLTGGGVPVQELRSDSPLLELLALGELLLGLDGNGALVTTSWPHGEAALSPVDCAPIGRVHALFPGPHPGSALVAGALGVALFERGRLASIASDLNARVSGAVCFGASRRVLLHGEDGEAWILDERLSRLSPAVRPSLASAIAGAAPGLGDSALVWTADGGLYSLSSSGAARLLLSGDVVLARLDRGGALAVHWSAGSGVRFTRAPAS